jgi:hypothetical protein
MKKSNKILVGGLLTIILIVLAVHIGLYANYKAGNYVPYTDKQAEEATNIKEFANTRSIDIRNLNNVVIRVGDKMRVEQYGEDNGDIGLTEQNGNVQLFRKDTTHAAEIFHYVIVYVPENTVVTSHKSYIRVESTNNKAIGHLSFNTTGGSLGFEQGNNRLQIDSLQVQATNRATVVLQNINIDALSIQLNASELIDRAASINRFSLEADSTSQINLQSKNLIKLITKTTAHE